MIFGSCQDFYYLYSASAVIFFARKLKNLLNMSDYDL